MPSSKNYKRDYKREMETARERGEDKDRAKRNRARRHMMKGGRVHKGDGKDVDHRVPLRSNGSKQDSNLRIRSTKANRSDNGHRKGEKK